MSYASFKPQLRNKDHGILEMSNLCQTNQYKFNLTVGSFGTSGSKFPISICY